MAEETKDAQFYRTRQMMTFLPVVAVPFMTIMFYLGDGGKGAVASSVAPQTGGINTDLPKAEKSSIVNDKLNAFGSQPDSSRNPELLAGKITQPTRPDSARNLSLATGPNGQLGTNVAADKSLEAAQQQLAALQQAQRSGGAAPSGIAGQPASSQATISPEIQAELLRSQRDRELQNQRTNEEIARISAQSMGAGAGAAPAAAVVAAVATPKAKKLPTTRAVMVDDNAVVSQLGKKPERRQAVSSTFRGFDSNGSSEDTNTLPAVIHESQEVVSGSLVKMRLTESAVINGHQVPANTFIYGKCSLQEERLTIAIQSLKSGSNIFPAALQVYDVDGLEGLHIPGAITRDATKQGAADAMGAADMMTMSANPGTAAAGVAVGAVRSLGQKKVRLVKVKLKAGYNIMLKVEKE